MSRLHIGRSFYHSFLFTDVPSVCIGCDERLLNIFFALVKILSKQERAVLQINHCVSYFKTFQWNLYLKRFETSPVQSSPVQGDFLRQ